MTNTVQEVIDFIGVAQKNRKYPEGTAHGLKAALKLFDKELNEEERSSLELFKKNLEQIYSSVYKKNQNSFSAGSLQTYKSRVLKAVADFEKYGVDPTKMANWQPKVISRTVAKRRQPEAVEVAPDQTEKTSPDNVSVSTNEHKIELAIRPGARILLILPRDLRLSDVTVAKSILDSLVIADSANLAVSEPPTTVVE